MLFGGLFGPNSISAGRLAAMTAHDPDGRIVKTVRLSQAGIDAIQLVADHYDCNWTEAARRMLALGSAGAPHQWPPEKWPPRGWGN